MINFRRNKYLNNRGVLGKLLRLPFKLIPHRTVLRIIRGFLAGKRWIKGAHNFSVILGIYEKSQTKLFVSKAKNLNVLWDLGAHVGYYSLLFLSTGAHRTVYAFEPLGRNCKLYKKHMKLNGISDYQLFQVATSNKNEKLKFSEGKSSVAGRLSDTGAIEVEVIKLSHWLDQGKLEIPDVIKMDIEGAESLVLSDIAELLVEQRPLIFLSTHSEEIHKNCTDLLKELGYKLTPLDHDDLSQAREILAEHTELK